MRRWMVVMCFCVLCCGIVHAQTPPLTRTLAPQEQIDLEATRILAGYTATAAAMPITPDDTDSFTTAAFGMVICSMLLVLIPLAFGVWRMNRSR